MMYREEEKHPELRAFCMVLYVITALSAVLQVFESTLMVGLLFLVVAYMMVGAQKMTARKTIYQSHIEYVAKTLSMGMGVIFPIAMVLAIYLIWKNTDISAIKAAIDSDDPDSMMSIVNRYVTGGMQIAQDIILKTMALPVFWWVRRCLVGFLRAKNSEPVDYPDSWI